jgi:hypothetical protein
MATRSTFEQRSICIGLSKPPNQQIDAAFLALNCEFPFPNRQKICLVRFRVKFLFLSGDLANLQGFTLCFFPSADLVGRKPFRSKED